MEHPIPQNVTSFEFHLIGDMTLKQFGYLAAGLITAYITFILVFPYLPLLAIPIMGFTSLSGAAFAFLPILDRPLDHWLGAFLKSIYSPTQAFWKSPLETQGKPVPQGLHTKNRLSVYLSTLGAAPMVTAPNIPATTIALPRPLANPQNLPPTAAVPATQEEKNSAPLNLPSSEELNKLVAMGQQSLIVQTKIAETEKQIDQFKAAISQPQTLPAQKQHYQQAVGNLQNLIKEVGDLYHQSAAVPHQKNSGVVIVEPLKQAKTQISLTSLPNVINGIITDMSGNYLEGVIVIIHNQDGLPVRALKTNKLGQFTGATPLPSGTYGVTLEKDNLEFGNIQITLQGGIIPPLQIRPRRVGSL